MLRFIAFIFIKHSEIQSNMASIQRIHNFIDGKFVPTENYLESYNPSTEEVFAYVADSSAEDAKLAIQAARKAFPSYVF